MTADVAWPLTMGWLIAGQLGFLAASIIRPKSMRRAHEDANASALVGTMAANTVGAGLGPVWVVAIVYDVSIGGWGEK